MSLQESIGAASLQRVSERPRFGCKGPLAEAWLRELALEVPQGANAWTCPTDGGVLIARLATSEFLVEAIARDGSPAHSRITEAARLLFDPRQRRAGLVPVLRQDTALELSGTRANDVLVETCNVNFMPLARAARADGGTLVLTSMIGVGVTVIARRAGSDLRYTIWCDPSFDHYLWSTLLEVATGMGN